MKKIVAILLGVFIICFSTMCRKKDKGDDCPVCPKVNSFSPQHGKYKDTIHIYGENFKTNPDGLTIKVNFNGMSAQIVSSTDDQVIAVVPNKCGTGPVRAYYDDELYGESSTPFVYDAIATTSTFAGQCGSGNLENTDPLLANFYSPDKIFLDEARGYVYFVNQGYTLCRISSAGVKTIITTADYIQSGACDASGNIYLVFPEYIAKVETGVGTMLKIIAGASGTAGHVDATGTAARFNTARAAAIDDADNLYIGENAYIRKLDLKTLAVTTIAGTSTTGFLDGPALSAKFNTIFSMSFDKNKNLYIADWNNSRIRKLSNGTVSTIAGDGTSAVKNGIGTLAQIQQPRSLTVDYDGKYIYFSDSFITSFLRKMNLATGEVSYFSGDLSVTGSQDGVIETATYNNPLCLVYSKSKNVVYIADNFNCKIRKISFE